MGKLIDTIEKYTLEQTQGEDDQEITGKYSFDNDFIGFSGHFPGYPILPAVLQLFMAQLLIEKQKMCSIRVTKIVKAKFISEIKPDDEITVQCLDAPTDETQRSKVKISCHGKPVSSFNLSYSLKENVNC